MLPLSFAAGITFWLTENELSPRAGWYVQLAQAGIYTLQPEMVQIPPKDVWQDESRRSFTMGSNEDSDEEPPHQVTFSQPFRIGEYEVTFDEYQVFAYLIEGDGGCEDLHKIKKPNDDGWGRGRRSVINVSWLDAICYTEWLNKRIGWLNEKTGKKFRLPTEAEWEYAARAGTSTKFWWGNEMKTQKAVCSECGSEWRGKSKGRSTAEVDDSLFQSNGWSLFHFSGNVQEWVRDCWHENYEGAPEIGDISWGEENGGDCSLRVIRGGSWGHFTGGARSTFRLRNFPDYGYDNIGFRLAQD